MSLQQEFETFHKAHPEVYEYFDGFTWEVICRGFKNYGARDIIHRIRWETGMANTDPQYKINNNHSPYYARLWMENNPAYKGFFRLRGVRSDCELEEAA